MNKAKQLLVSLLVFTLFFLFLKTSIVRGVRDAKNGWKANPVRMATKIIVSCIIGQGIFWKIGYDQLGLFMNPKKQIGFGQKVAEEVYDNIPQNSTAAWIIKVLEILTDAGKIPIEGALYSKHGIVPDGVAAVVTQPLWATVETAEKTAGAIIHPERVTEPEQVRLSLGCIYGSIFRYSLAAIFWATGAVVYKVIGSPIEFGLNKAILKVKS